MDYQPAHFQRLPAPEAIRARSPLMFPVTDYKAVEVASGVFWIAAGSNAGWVVTPDGVVLIDSGMHRREVYEELARTTAGAPVRYVIYTHGHEDHVLLEPRFRDLVPDAQVIGHGFLPERLRKYEQLRPHLARINSIQFHLAIPPVERQYKYPDIVYWDRHELELGGRRFELFHGRGETDDATVVHVPDAGVVFAGDFLISVLPNLGNPYKVPRYAAGWIETLERIAALKPKAVAPGHGTGLVSGEDVDAVLGDTVRGLRYIHDEVVRRMNDGQSLDQMVTEVRLPPELEDSRHLRQTYSRVEFAVMAIRRGYDGWFDGDPSDLLPVPRQAVARELRALIGDDAALLARAAALWSEGLRRAALELVQVILRDDPKHTEARRLRLRFMEELVEADRCVMSRGAWHHFATEDRAALGEAAE
jgi:glyoxylase-like metal-dependent hydrolase (beta-lactamase superfamily II)